MIIRPATNSDTQAITELVFDVLESYGLRPDPGETDIDLSDIKSHYFDKGGHFDVLEDAGGKIIGTVGIYAMKGHMCELRKMYLNPNHRGKGYGKMLLDHAIDKAKELGFTSMILETASALKEAISLYRKYGFKPYKADHLSCRCDQAYLRML